MKQNERIIDIVNKTDVPYAVIHRYNSFVTSKNGSYPGRTLRFPRVHVVLPGDTHQSISERYGVLPSYMKELNPYMGDQQVLYPGQTVFLPPA